MSGHNTLVGYHVIGVPEPDLVTYTGPKDMLVAFLSGQIVNRTQAAFDESEWVDCKITAAQKQEMLRQLDLPG